MPPTFEIARKKRPNASSRTVKTGSSSSDSKVRSFEPGTLNPERHAMPSGTACPCGGGCPRCQAEKKSSLTNLKLGQPGDAAEHEADHVAEQVTHAPHNNASAHAVIKGKSDLRISRQPAAAVPARSENAPPIVHEAIKSPGQGLGADARSTMESRFGRSFADVQVHTDAKAAESADAVDAHAYTVGNNIVFGRGQYAPGSSAGQRLLAHELTHVVQQSGHGDHTLQRQPKQSPAPDPTAIDPKNLGTLGPAFQKSEAEVRKLGLKEMRLADSTNDQDSVLFWAQNSTVPLRKLRSGTPVFLAGGVRGEKSLVWAYPEGETNMFMGYVKTTLLLDVWVAKWVQRQPPLFNLTAPNLSPPSVATQPSVKDSWDEALGLSEPSQPPAALPESTDPSRINWKTFRKIVSEALARHDNIAWDAFKDVYAKRNSLDVVGHLVGDPDPCLDPNLAAADHYLFARTLVMDFGFPAFFVKAMNGVYTPLKNILLSHGFDPALAKCPTSPGTIEQQLAGDMGADDGSLIGHPENWKYKPFGRQKNHTGTLY